jgi:WD40 repeat protein
MVNAVAFSPDGKLVATGSGMLFAAGRSKNDNTARIVAVADGREVARVTHDSAVNAVAFSPDSKLLATGR